MTDLDVIFKDLEPPEDRFDLFRDYAGSFLTPEFGWLLRSAKGEKTGSIQGLDPRRETEMYAQAVKNPDTVLTHDLVDQQVVVSYLSFAQTCLFLETDASRPDMSPLLIRLLEQAFKGHYQCGEQAQLSQTRKR